MGLDKRTIKIIVVVAVVLIVIGGIIGLLLGLLLPQHYVELQVFPRSEEYSYKEPVIQFRSSDPGSWHPWYKRISDFLKVYETSIPEVPPRAPCSTHNERDQHMRSEACDLAMKMWAPCTADQFYGYPMGNPCVFLRLEYIHYWVPEPYNMTSALPVPIEMPPHLQQAMRQYPANQYGDHVWVSCGGEFTADQENIGPIQYIPARLPPGFPTKRLHTADRIPYIARNLPDQTPGPIVAVFFENPRHVNDYKRKWFGFRIVKRLTDVQILSLARLFFSLSI